MRSGAGEAGLAPVEPADQRSGLASLRPIRLAAYWGSKRRRCQGAAAPPAPRPRRAA
jgi:hypothetical protein